GVDRSERKRMADIITNGRDAPRGEAPAPASHSRYSVVTVREMPSDERPRERLERYGAGALQTAELLAIILRTGLQGENVIDLSQRLLRDFGGLAGLVAADLSDLCQAHGLGLAKASQLKAALEIANRLATLGPEQRPRITSPSDVARLLMFEMAYLAQEQLRVLCLDTKNHVVAQQTVYQGTVNSSAVRVAEVFRPAITRTCPSVIVVHNHPSGDPTPSPEDVRTTEQLRKAGELLDIELLDHIVIGRHQHVSLKERGLGF
ncbi:MAG TPA: DNA repair protein RadC, partial [Ktedonobacterales bacterium]|nr:DNA repair protein RadC [Ktedonobacterales bacterium]